VLLRRGGQLYFLKYSDKGGDGLEFWYKAKDGRGELKLLDTLMGRGGRDRP